LQSFNQAPLSIERSPPLDSASWRPYPSLPLTYQFPTSPEPAHKENGWSARAPVLA